MRYKVYTDGGYDMLTMIGASAVVFPDSNTGGYYYRWAKGRKCSFNPEKKQRTNEQELGAIIRAVMVAPEGSELDLYSDSQYAINVLSGRWEAKANLDLIAIYSKVVFERNIKVYFHWVKGHNGNLYNEIADDLCNYISAVVKETGKTSIFETEKHF